MNQVEIYKSLDNKIELSVSLDQKTVWLTQEPSVLLFERDQSVISGHLRNVFKEENWMEKGICKKCILQIERAIMYDYVLCKSLHINLCNYFQNGGMLPWNPGSSRLNSTCAILPKFQVFTNYCKTIFYSSKKVAQHE